MRLLVLLISSLLLGACTNMVRSEAPWFGPADSAGAPPLRDGVWAADDPNCPFDANLPLERWPACAQGRVVQGGEELTLDSFTSQDGRGRLKRVDYDWSSEAFVLAAGAPRIHQRACGAPRGGVEAVAEEPAKEGAMPAPSVDGSAIDGAVTRLVYCYAGLRPDALDAEGRIVAFTTWPIWCGPFPQRAEGEAGPNVTEAPFPGLSVVGEHCVAADVAALLAAATASETLELSGPLGPTRFRWIRNGWR